MVFQKTLGMWGVSSSSWCCVTLNCVVHAPVQHNSMNEFMYLKSPKFNGKATLDEVDEWIRENEFVAG